MEGEEKARAGQDWWPILAVELKQHIWSYLDGEEIIMATTVCSEWRYTLLADQHQPWATIFQRFRLTPPNIVTFSFFCFSDCWVVLVLRNKRGDGKNLV